MPKPFVPLSLDQFRELLKNFPFTRKVNAVHMHHTWRPNRAQYKGLASIDSMYRAHTQERKFSDIAQHITIAPDGTIWTGRNWNYPPASAVGHNGNAEFGPFMFEMIGDFDTGKDEFEDPQRQVALEVIAAVQRRFGLAPGAVHFHREMADKTCPGSAIDYSAIVAAVRDMHAASPEARGFSEEAPFSATYRDDRLTGADRAVVDSAMQALMQATETAEASAEAELPESDQKVEFVSKGGLTSAASRGVEMTTADLVGLRPHVIDLNQGMLTPGGEFSTLPEDVERIFGEDMETAFANPEMLGMPPRKPGDPFRIMVWAHGGLIGERAGLAIAQKHLEFWKKNGIYPVYFVWETGFFQTIGQLLRGLLPGGGARALFATDTFTDPLLERVARVAGGEMIWSGIKRNAERGSAPDGGATKAAQEFKKFCDRHAGQLDIHASGHSAGAIFHAHFLPLAIQEGIPDITALHFLAPAIRVDTFKRRLLGFVGKQVKHLNLFTMFKEQELDDNCAEIYQKSLLYLIRFGLEREPEAEILGLEECVRRDRDLAALFGLGGTQRGAGEAVFSPSSQTDGPRASQSLSHGGFDDDAATMNSIAMRILNLNHKSELPMSYSEGGRAFVDDPWTAPEVTEFQRSFASAVSGRPAAATPELSAVPQRSPAIASPSPGGGRRALCVGIDRYPIKALAGCVADARLWAGTLQRLNFQCDTLLDGDATYANIKAHLQALLSSARAGDVVVWQYSGHGTQVPDVNGDEKRGDSPGQDEAICPVDLQSGRFLIDDEIGELLDGLQPGVNFTMFIDCCHSGTINRFGFGEPPDPTSFRDERPRFIPLTDELKQAYLQFAQSQAGGSRAFTPSRKRDAIQQTSEVLFSACLSTEVAWESNGQGEFTLRATKLLSDRGLGVSNEEFTKAVVSAFGPSPRQTPNMTCATAFRSLPLLAPLAPAGTGGAIEASASAESRVAGTSGRFGGLATALDAVARELRGL